MISIFIHELFKRFRTYRTLNQSCIFIFVVRILDYNSDLIILRILNQFFYWQFLLLHELRRLFTYSCFVVVICVLSCFHNFIKSNKTFLQYGIILRVFNVTIDNAFNLFKDSVLEEIAFEAIRFPESLHDVIEYGFETVSSRINQFNNSVETCIDLSIVEYSVGLIKFPD